MDKPTFRRLRRKALRRAVSKAGDAEWTAARARRLLKRWVAEDAKRRQQERIE